MFCHSLPFTIHRLKRIQTMLFNLGPICQVCNSCHLEVSGASIKTVRFIYVQLCYQVFVRLVRGIAKVLILYYKLFGCIDWFHTSLCQREGSCKPALEAPSWGLHGTHFAGIIPEMMVFDSCLWARAVTRCLVVWQNTGAIYFDMIAEISNS